MNQPRAAATLASCILANISMDLGRPLTCDPTTRSIPGATEATARLCRARRGFIWRRPDALRRLDRQDGRSFSVW